MKITNVSLMAAEAALDRPILTPELLAATGARYSRNNEGLEAIIEKIDPDNLDKSVDGIFKMIDYGHKSIGDMAPVAMFIDDISILLAYLVWSWCPTASGQESSTRYIRLEPSGVVDAEMFSVSYDQRNNWEEFIQESFEAYQTALDFWGKVGQDHPELTNIPQSLLNDTSDKAVKKVDRMKRNFAFDRARYFLPVAAKTNMMLVMNANGWVDLCQNLLSITWLPEAVEMGKRIKSELELVVPRMVKHASEKTSFHDGLGDEFVSLVEMANDYGQIPFGEQSCESYINLSLPQNVSEFDLVKALSYHDNRYAYMGQALRRTSVRFGWNAVSIAEIRDLNRHRTGHKYCPLVPQGFYCAQDQLPVGKSLPKSLVQLGCTALAQSILKLQGGQQDYAAWMLLGFQFPFEHATQLDKFVYEAELRTGIGAHYRYASHFRDIVNELGSQYPQLAAAIELGGNEPE